MRRLTKAVILLSLLTGSAHAFEMRTGALMFSGAGGGYSYTDSSGHTDYYDSKDSTNLILEIGHYKNSDKKGFGFGWRLGGSYPLDTDEWYEGATAEWGFAIGYTIIEDLDIKGEFGLGLNFINQQNMTVTAYGGIGLDYAIMGHYIVGASLKKYQGLTNSHRPATDDYDYAPTATTIYLGYRF